MTQNGPAHSKRDWVSAHTSSWAVARASFRPGFPTCAPAPRMQVLCPRRHPTGNGLDLAQGQGPAGTLDEPLQVTEAAPL